MLSRVRSALQRVGNVLTIVAAVLILAAASLVGWVTITDRHARAAATPNPQNAARQPPRPDAVTQMQGVVMKLSSTRDGSGTAKVAMVEFSDFQCPFCGRYAREVYPKLRHDYVDAGKVAYTFRNFPLEDIHPFAAGAARAAECARGQSAFWPMHDVLFANQPRLDSGSLLKYAADLRLNRTAFKQCLANDATESMGADSAEASRLGVSSTPTFFLGLLQANGSVAITRAIKGAQPVEVFTRTIDDLLREARRSL